MMKFKGHLQFLASFGYLRKQEQSLVKSSLSGYVRDNFEALIVWTHISWKVIWLVINLLPHKTRSPSKYSRLEIVWGIPISWEQLLTCLIVIYMDVGVTNHTLISGCNQLEVIVVWLFNLNLDFWRWYISKLLKFELYFCTEVIMQYLLPE